MERKYIALAVLGLFALAIGAGYVYVQSTTYCPALLSVDPVENETVADEDVVEFDALAPHQQDEFERALESGHAEIESQSDWEYEWIVRYRGTNYSIATSIC